MKIRTPRSFVARLLKACGPLTVAWLVVAVIVNPFNAIATARLRSHVGQEVLVSRPSLAHLNSARTIPSVALIIGIVASRAHVYPVSIGSHVVDIFAMPMSKEILSPKASATSGMAILQKTANHGGVVATLATTKPPCAAFIVRTISTQYKQAPESPSNELEHKSQYIMGVNA